MSPTKESMERAREWLKRHSTGVWDDKDLSSLAALLDKVREEARSGHAPDCGGSDPNRGQYGECGCGYLQEGGAAAKRDSEWVKAVEKVRKAAEQLRHHDDLVVACRAYNHIQVCDALMREMKGGSDVS